MSAFASDCGRGGSVTFPIPLSPEYFPQDQFVFSRESSAAGKLNQSRPDDPRVVITRQEFTRNFVIRCYRHTIFEKYRSAFSRLCTQRNPRALTIPDIHHEYENMTIRAYHTNPPFPILENLISRMTFSREEVYAFEGNLRRKDHLEGRLLRLYESLAERQIDLFLQIFRDEEEFNALVDGSRPERDERAGAAGLVTAPGPTKTFAVYTREWEAEPMESREYGSIYEPVMLAVQEEAHRLNFNVFRSEDGILHIQWRKE